MRNPEFLCPEGENVMVWAGACALAEQRHPNARYPQPVDVSDARIVTTVVVELIAERILPRGVTRPRALDTI